MIYLTSTLHLSMLDRTTQKTGNPLIRSPVPVTIEQARDYVRHFSVISYIRSKQAASTLGRELGINVDVLIEFKNVTLREQDNLLIAELIPYTRHVGKDVDPLRPDIAWWIV